jgi:hypothetical protein
VPMIILALSFSAALCRNIMQERPTMTLWPKLDR